MKGDNKRIIIRQNGATNEAVVFGDRFDRSSLTPKQDQAFMANIKDHVVAERFPAHYRAMKAG